MTMIVSEKISAAIASRKPDAGDLRRPPVKLIQQLNCCEATPHLSTAAESHPSHETR